MIYYHNLPERPNPWVAVWSLLGTLAVLTVMSLLF